MVTITGDKAAYGIIIIEHTKAGDYKELLGFVIAILNAGKDVHVSYICSTSSIRGGGRALMESLFDYVKSSGYPKKITLTSLPSVKGFYLNLGFKDLGKYEFVKELK